MNKRYMSLIAAVVMVAGCGKDGRKQVDGATGQSQMQTAYPTANEAADAFADAVFNDPDRAYLLMNQEWRTTASREQFVQGVKMLLPPPKTIRSVTRDGDAAEWQDEEGRESWEYSYDVRSTDDFQPRCKMTVDVAKAPEGFVILRFRVAGSPPTGS